MAGLSFSILCIHTIGLCKSSIGHIGFMPVVSN